MNSTLLKRFAFLSLVIVPVACSDDGEQTTSATDATDTEDDDGDDDNGDDNDDSADNSADNSATDTDPSATITDTGTDDTDPTADESTDATADESSTDATADESSTDAGESSSTGTEGTTTDTDTGTGECAVITIDTDLIAVSDTTYIIEQPDLVGDPTIDDIVAFDFYDGASGTFDLAAAPNDNYSTCAQCVLVLEDDNAIIYYQAEGTLDLADDPTDGTLAGSITGVRLVEVTIDPNTFVSTPVPDGGCIELTDGDIASAPPVEVPVEWTCNPDYYSDADCDCGCGVLDPTCMDETVDSCEFCNDPGSCGEDAGVCPGNIDPDNNAVCV